MHLTNYSVNKGSEDFVKEPDDILSANDATKRTLTALFNQI